MLQLLDTIANVKPIPWDRLTLVEAEHGSVSELPVGQVGTIVEVYAGPEPRYLVEFADPQGREYAMAVLQADEVLMLHYELSVTPSALRH